MLTVDEALEHVARASAGVRVRVETVPLLDALGRTLAEDVVMDHDVPPFRRAAMDGYAVRRTDLAAGARLDVTSKVAAGEVPSRAVGPGEAAHIMTGASMPEGADVVVPVEGTRAVEGRVLLERPQGPDGPAYVVEPGEHVRSGETVLRRGTLLRAGDLGVLATAGRAEVPVAARPGVAVLGTGSELVDVGERPGPGRIRNSNTFSLLAQARVHGARPVSLGTAADDMAALRAAIRRGLESDVLVLSGGVSRGDLDLVPGALEAEGVRCAFHRWRVQPGGPLWFGTKDGGLVFGLPGNPAASFVGFEILVVPAIRARLGRPFAARETFRVRYDGPWSGPSERRRFRPVRLVSDADGGLRAEPVPWKGSGDPFGVARGEALVVLPEGRTSPGPAPATVDAVPLAQGLLA